MDTGDARPLGHRRRPPPRAESADRDTSRPWPAAALPAACAPSKRVRPSAASFGAETSNFAARAEPRGAAIGLATLGRVLGLAFATMLAHAAGTGLTLFSAAYGSRAWLRARSGDVLRFGAGSKRVLAATMALLGILVLTGLDKCVETWAIGVVPDWVSSL